MFKARRTFRGVTEFEERRKSAPINDKITFRENCVTWQIYTCFSINIDEFVTFVMKTRIDIEL